MRAHPSLKDNSRAFASGFTLPITFPMSNPNQTYVAVVDDDEKVCQSFGRLLRAAGLHPVTYSSAEAFLADMKQPQFDCLVLDVQLGGMSGIELAKQLVCDGTPPPFIFITAHDDPAARAEAEAAGCAAYFQKTDAGAQVLETIRRIAA
jgi:FixJ family two-component response regulator